MDYKSVMTVGLEQTLLIVHSAPKMWLAQLCHQTVIIGDRGLPLPQHEQPLMTLKEMSIVTAQSLSVVA